MAGIRTFVAVGLDGRLCGRIARRLEPLQTGRRGVRWVKPNQFHFTLSFLGDIDPRQAPGVCAAVADASAGFAPFEIELAGIGAFPNRDRPSTLWIGVDNGKEEMRKLQSAVACALEPLGFPPEKRPFSAHLTFGRIDRFRRPDPELLAALATLESCRFGSSPVEAVFVMKSDLERTGSVYSIMATCPLRRSGER